MIEIKNLNISFGDKVILNNASFHTSPGVLTIIRGKSGSGKSTFLKPFNSHMSVNIFMKDREWMN